MRLSAEEMGWSASCLVWVYDEVVVPLVFQRLRGRVKVMAESLPLGQIGGPIASGKAERDVTTLVVDGLRRSALEVLVYPSGRRFCPRGWEERTHRVHVVQLNPKSMNAWQRASRKCRSAARHAIRSGVEVVEATGGANLDQTVRLHHLQQRGRGAVSYPNSWWKRLLKEADKNVGLWCAVQNGEVVAALLIAWWHGKAVALISTGEPSARPLKAGNLLYLTVLKKLEALGLQSVDLGGSRDKQSLELFKQSVGATIVERSYYRNRRSILKLYQRLIPNGRRS